MSEKPKEFQLEQFLLGQLEGCKLCKLSSSLDLCIRQVVAESKFEDKGRVVDTVVMKQI